MGASRSGPAHAAANTKPLLGMWFLVLLYFAGIFLKGAIWGMAFRAQNPGSDRWVYRPFMSVVSALCLSWLLGYSILTLRKGNLEPDQVTTIRR